MANKVIKNTVILFLTLLLFADITHAKNQIPKSVYLTNLNHINITNNATKDLKQLKKIIKQRKPKAIYIEQWILLEPNNKNLIKKLSKLAKKHEIKFYLVVGKNTWFGGRGIANTIPYFNEYGKYIDGIVLRIEPNKVNIWKNYENTRAEILNYMLNAYSTLYQEAKKRNLQFIAEFPFWLGDFKGFKKSFPEDACMHSSKLIFLIDNPEMFDKLESSNVKWNEVSCMYNINLTRRATGLSDDLLKEMYNKIKDKFVFYSNFNGFIVDADSTLFDPMQKS